MRTLIAIALLAAPAFAADPAAQVFDRQVSSIEREVLSLAQAMPADKYNFAPTNGAFTGVRTFGTQVSHLATEIWRISAELLGEKPPVDTGAGEDGPANLKTKDQIVDYFKKSLDYAHKAMNTLTTQNLMEPPPGSREPRVSMASFLALHTNDHYGQMVVYARMNGVIPPASQPQGPPPGAKAKGKK